MIAKNTTSMIELRITVEFMINLLYCIYI
jgi:hypothetical protein